MAAHALSRERTEALRAASLTYEGVGATAQTAPPGYEALSRSRLMARRDFDSTVEDLMTWRVHEQAGLEVTASSPRVEEGAVLMLRLGVGALALRAPCRIVYVVDEPRRRGFAYGTLPGHPESGEELFVVHQRDDGQLAFTISAFSKHASAPARIGGRITRWVQQRMTTRYLRALDRLGQ